MENPYPVIVGDSDDELTFEKCALCDNEAMMLFEGKGYCGMHYAEKMGWLEHIENKDENPIPEPSNAS